MKKTIIALMALAGLASGATVDTIDTTDTNLVWYWDFSSNSATSGGIAYSNAPTLNAEGEYAVISSGSGMYTNNSALSNVGLTSTQSFTVSFDIRSFGSGDVFSLAVSDDDDWKKIMLTSNQGENLKLKFYGNSQSVDSGIAYGTRTEWTTITLVGDDSITEGVKLYVDGVLKGSFDMTAATNWRNGAADGFQFAGSFRNNGTTVT